VKGDLVIGSPKQGTKAILENWGLRKDVGKTPFLQRRLHLWFEIKPKTVNADDPMGGGAVLRSLFVHAPNE
jgi:hypothetical protein